MPRRPLRAGIFAAGVGARLGSAAGRPKGLTPIAGRPLVDWILDDLDAAGVSETVIIINEQSIALREHVGATRHVSNVRWIVETTPSSMHSFLRVLETLADGDEGPFLISTVDTIAPPGTFSAFIDRAGEAPGADVVLALTTPVDDDNPFRVDLGSDPEYDPTQGLASGRNQGLTLISAVGRGPYATAGYYLAWPTVLAEAAAGRQANLGALRHFFAHLFDRGYRMTGIYMPDSVDVDRPQDIAAAERLLRAAPATNQ